MKLKEAKKNVLPKMLSSTWHSNSRTKEKMGTRNLKEKPGEPAINLGRGGGRGEGGSHYSQNREVNK